MKPCPRCRRNLLDGVGTCPFCKSPVGPGASPVRSGDLPSLGGDIRAEPYTLNWFVLLKRCLSPSGRFSRAQFAVAYPGTLAMSWAAMLAIVFGMQAAGFKGDAAETTAGLAVLGFVPFILIAAVGGTIRRWHDLGQSGWMVLLNFIPCVGVVVVLYLLFAPGKPELDTPVESTPILAIVAGVLVFGVCGVGMIAAIAIPSLLRARVSANEAATIADIRMLISAQEAYRSANGGFYEANLQCLAAPSVGCLPNYPAKGPAFLDPVLAGREPKSGYDRRFEPGRMVAVDAAASSPTSVGEYAYVATPIKAMQTGVRSFCGDSTGLICYRVGGEDIGVLGGACPSAAQGCTPLP